MTKNKRRGPLTAGLFLLCLVLSAAASRPKLRRKSSPRRKSNRGEWPEPEAKAPQRSEAPEAETRQTQSERGTREARNPPRKRNPPTPAAVPTPASSATTRPRSFRCCRSSRRSTRNPPTHEHPSHNCSVKPAMGRARSTPRRFPKDRSRRPIIKFGAELVGADRAAEPDLSRLPSGSEPYRLEG